MKRNKLQRQFRRYGILSIISIYLLVLAGGIVRSTGSGMGCPDWPKCFGNWLPPSSESKLPNDYKEVFKLKRHKKNQKLAKYLVLFGFNNLADQVLNEKTDPVNLQFNVRKTYIEYLNRVVGVVSGILIFISFLYSFSFIPETWKYTWLSFINLVLVAFQGWIGSLVVSTDLLHWMVTVHMLLTVVILALILYMVYKVSVSVQNPYYSGNFSIKVLLIGSIFFSLVQMTLGTQVREEIDLIAKSLSHMNRDLWIDQLGIDFIIHRSFSWFILGINLLLIYLIYTKFKAVKVYKNLVNLLVFMVLLEVFAGVVLAYFSIPAFIQPIHLLLAFLIFGIQFLFLLIINFKKSPHYLSM